MVLIFLNRYRSCETCFINIYGSNETHHNYIECWDNHYPSPENSSNCYSIEEKKNDWYLDSNTLKFEFCHKQCKSCTGPTKFNCTSCNNGLHLDNGVYTNNCSPGYYTIKGKTEQDDYILCRECHQNCETCSNSINSESMNCATCKENHIKYNDNCYEIVEPLKKTFLVFNNSDINNQTSSCFQMFELYIKEDFDECIPLSDNIEGYFLSNNETGLLSKCHDNYLSCYQGPILDNSGYIISMECSKCVNSNDSLKTMIKMDNNCFQIIQYDEIRILFNILEINPNITLGSCKYLGKAIYYGEYNRIDKPDDSFYVLNGDENTGVIKDFYEDSDSIYIENRKPFGSEFENELELNESSIIFNVSEINIDIEEEFQNEEEVNKENKLQRENELQKENEFQKENEI